MQFKGLYFADSIENHFPTQNLLSDAEVTICKYKWLIISTNAFVFRVSKVTPRDGGGGRKIGKNLQI